jgi:hypothetical protein
MSVNQEHFDPFIQIAKTYKLPTCHGGLLIDNELELAARLYADDCEQKRMRRRSTDIQAAKTVVVFLFIALVAYYRTPFDASIIVSALLYTLYHGFRMTYHSGHRVRPYSVICAQMLPAYIVQAVAVGLIVLHHYIRH